LFESRIKNANVLIGKIKQINIDPVEIQISKDLGTTRSGNSHVHLSPQVQDQMLWFFFSYLAVEI
jgi:hypothetical protein